MKKKIAIIVQRYGEEVSGGGEYYAKTVAEHLTNLYDVDIITTTCLDYLAWDNHYPEGKTNLNGVNIIRFKPEHERDWPKFNELSGKIHEKIIKNQETDYKMDQEWIEAEGPYCPKLVEYVSSEIDNYDVIFIITYIYYTAVKTLPIVAKKCIFIPTAHDDIWIRLSIYKQLFSLPKYFIFLSDEEKRFTHKFFSNDYIPNDVVGTGISIPKNLDVNEFKNRFNIDDEYVVFVGRIDISKSCDFMIDSFIKFKEKYPSNLKLVLIGKSTMKIPKRKDIVKTGFISEEEKFSGIKGALCMLAPSKYESLCIALLEGFGVGIPAIVNGESEVLKEHCVRSNAGLYYTNYLEFEKELKFFLDDKVEGALMGKNGERYIQNFYTWDKVISKFSKIIDTVSEIGVKNMKRNVFEDKQDFSNTIIVKTDETIDPVFEDNYVSIAFSSSDYFSPILSVAISSLIENTDDKVNYDIVVFITDMSSYNKNLLSSMIQKNNISLRFVNVEKIIESYKFSLASHYTKFTFYRLLIPKLMGKYEKTLYLDSDLVVNHDVAKLYNTDIKDYFLGGTRDFTVLCWQKMGKRAEMKKYFDELGLSEPGMYMQAGVSLYNIKKFKEELPSDFLMNKATERTYLACDQDVINIYCKGKIKYIDCKWNMVNMHPGNIDIYNNYLPEEYYNEYIEARNNPYIIHYSAQLIPCFKTSVDQYHYFWKYARNSPYYEELISMVATTSMNEINSKIDMKFSKLSRIKNFKNRVIFKMKRILKK